MSVQVNIDSLYRFATPYYDENQEQYVWGIADPPDPAVRDDDQFFTLRADDRLDLIAYKMLGEPRYMWIIMHYNGIKDALALEPYVGKQLRIPSRSTVERIYAHAFNFASGS